MKSNLLRFLLAGLALVSTLSAQTWTGSTSLAWDDAANWNPAVVPDGAGSLATFTPAGLATTTNNLAIAGGHTLGGIQFAPDTPSVVLYIDNSSGPGNLTLAGAGLKNTSTSQQSLWLSSTNFNGAFPAELTFRNQATVAGNVRLIAIGSDRHIAFRDQSSAGSATMVAYVVDFYDQATAGAAVFDQGMGQQITFHDNSTAGSAQLPGFYGSVTFADNSSAGNATVIRPSNYGGSSQVIFRDHAGAGHGAFLVNNLSFSGNSSAENAALNNAGVQYYSSHGAYATYPANLVFRDQATAGHAAIGNNSLGSLRWTDDATADHAIINSSGAATWSDRASFGDAKLVASSGAYYGFGGYNQQAPSIPTGGVYFKDQAQGGNGSIEIASAGAWLDFSGLATGTGTTGRAALPAYGPTTGDVTPDDAGTISFGSIRNTTAGGNIYLGGTALRLGGDNSDATLSARIRDAGGAYGSASGGQLRGGSLIKTGLGTLTISNPDNSYGNTLIAAGTVRLDGGRISNATVAAAGRLTGNGVVQGALQNSGLVSPGNSPGTITVLGDFLQTPSGALAIEIASPTNYDRLTVSGTATLAGTLNLSFPGGIIPVGNSTFVFLTGSVVTGRFTTVSAPGGFGAALDSELIYAGSGVSLQVTQHPFAGFGGASPAAAALGRHLDATLAGSTGDYRDLIARLNTLPNGATIATALDALAPDRYAALGENSLLAAATQQAARDRRFAALRTPASHGFEAFFEVGQRRSNLAAGSGLPKATSSLNSGTAGAAWHREGFGLGASVTQEDGDLELDRTGSKAGLKSTLPAVFFQYAADRWFVNASAAFGHDDYDLQRRIVFAGFDHTATGTTSGARHDFAVNLGTTLHASAWAFTPQVGVLASRWQLEGFTETGAAGADLTIFDQSISSLRTRAGFEATATGQRFSPQIAVFWLHETKDDRSWPAAFAGAANSPYAAPGRPVDTNTIQASVGFDCRLGKHAVLNASIAGLWGGNARVTSDISAAFRWEF